MLIVFRFPTATDYEPPEPYRPGWFERLVDVLMFAGCGLGLVWGLGKLLQVVEWIWRQL